MNGTLLGLLVEGVIVAGASGVIYASYYWSSRSVIFRKLRKLPRTPIAQAVETELVRIVGTVKQLEPPVRAPVSGAPCVYYKVIVEQRYREGWRTMITDAAGAPFWLEDESGRAIIDPLAAEITTRHLRFLPALRRDPILDPYLARHGLFMKHRLRIREMRISVGEQIAVMGSATGERDPLAPPPEGYRAERTTTIRFSGSSKYPLVISDDPALKRL
ncbi:MAG TPA: hypothetical protein VFQ53_23100 [Kofleriaceae bacterium]|nr:hypothetical protein [Kofleriaceae bacterium]